MRGTLALVLLTCLYLASATLLVTKAQGIYANCHDIFACTTGTGTTSGGNTECTLNVSIHACGGGQPGGVEACINSGCVQDCH